jgi:hypothetical protein
MTAHSLEGFTLIEGQRSASPSVAVAIIGLLFVLASIISVRDEPRALADVLFLVTLAVTFIVQLIFGVLLSAHPGNTGDQQTLAILVVVFFLIGIGRSWELIEGPSIGIGRELVRLLRPPRSGEPPE